MQVGQQRDRERQLLEYTLERTLERTLEQTVSLFLKHNVHETARVNISETQYKRCEDLRRRIHTERAAPDFGFFG